MSYEERKIRRTTGNIDLGMYDLPPHSDTSVGMQLRFNHIDCPAGVDTKQRLYVKAVDTGWIAYCHHCGNHGFLRTTKYRINPKGIDYPDEHLRDYGTKGIPLKYTKDVITKVADFPAAQLLWLYSYGFTDTDIAHYGIGVGTDGSIILNKYDMTHDNRAVYIRRKYSTDFSKGPKAILYKENDNMFIWYNNALSCPADHVVLVEDPISAMKLHKLGASVISLMGTNLTSDHRLYLTLGGFDHIMIMLDPDIAGKKAALKIKKQLQSIVSNVIIYEDKLGFQPKEADAEYLKQDLQEEGFIV